MRMGQVPGARVSRTTGGVFIEPLAAGGDGPGGSRVKQYILTDASNGDYFVCRTLGTRTDDTDPENPLTLRAIGATDVFIAKPFHLRQTPFDREELNAEALGDIGTVDEITYDVVVESWDDPDLLTETRRLSHDYKSATFRIVTNESDPDTGNWTTQNQTIIPRFVPGELIVPSEEAEDQNITTETITPTVIYAASCSGLNITTSEDDGEVAVSLLAQCDAWAWSKTS
jgi:hypothetical protein